MDAQRSAERARGDADLQRSLHLKLVEFGRERHLAVEDGVLAILSRVPAYRWPFLAGGADLVAHAEFWRGLGLREPLDLEVEAQAEHGVESPPSNRDRRAA